MTKIENPFSMGNHKKHEKPVVNGIPSKAGDAGPLDSGLADVGASQPSDPEMTRQEHIDLLTGLPSRHFFREELIRSDSEENLPLTIAFCDVNKLKLLNDAMGYAVGDRLLKSVAAILLQSGRPEDVVARIANDEFALILPKTDEATAVKILERMKDQILHDPFNPLMISVAFGSRTKHHRTEKMTDVSHQAQQELMREKTASKTSLVGNTVVKILMALFERNRFEREHSKSVGILCEKIGNYLGLLPKEIHRLKIAGMMHDIGKITIDEAVLHKKGKLTRIEWAKIKNHAEAGYQILSSTAKFAGIAETVQQHHEKWDGTGYPCRLQGEAIFLDARILAVAEAYDALTSIRSYRLQLSKEAAFAEIRRCSGTQFDPKIVQIFIENYSE